MKSARMGIALSRLLRNARHHHFVDYLAAVNSGISAVALFPQLFSVVRGMDVRGLSASSFFLIALNSGVWVAYAVHRRMPPLLVSSALNAVAAVGILVFIFARG